MFEGIDNPKSFIQRETALHAAPLVPEIQLYLAHEDRPLWQLREEELAASPLNEPYWAFAWAGGQALARHLLDHPDLVAGKTVLSFAAGSGIEAIAAAKAGATTILAADIDPYAAAATELNAAANGVTVATTTDNLIGQQGDWDVVLAGDVLYEPQISDRIIAWLETLAAQGTTILIGDPGRTFCPTDKLTRLATYRVATNRELEDTDVRATGVWTL